jgi:hypothetical protein
MRLKFFFHSSPQFNSIEAHKAFRIMISVRAGSRADTQGAVILARFSIKPDAVTTLGRDEMSIFSFPSPRRRRRRRSIRF